MKTILNSVGMFGWFSRVIFSGFAVAIIAILGYLIVPVSNVYAYDGSTAAGYADRYSLNPNSGSYPVFDDDCTNFVSQAVNYGGYSMVGDGQSPTDDHNWYMDPCPICGGYTWSNAWSVASWYYGFLGLDYPGGWNWGTASGTSTNSSSGLNVGDVLFFDWDNDGGIDHAAILVGNGTDPDSGWSGDLADEHTTNRYHAFWSLCPYNSMANSTVITLEHIDPNNT